MPQGHHDCALGVVIVHAGEGEAGVVYRVWRWCVFYCLQGEAGRHHAHPLFPPTPSFHPPTSLTMSCIRYRILSPIGPVASKRTVKSLLLLLTSSHPTLSRPGL
jgi:hypothetical protein